MATERSAPVDAPSVVVTGATSLVGDFLLPRLRHLGYGVAAVSRAPSGPSSNNTHPGLSWHRMSGRLSQTSPALPAVTTLVHLAPLWLLPEWLQDFAALGGKRVIGFSSTSRVSKLRSALPEERALAKRLALAEQRVAELCEQLDIAWTLFRPTLIYGAGRDRNISFIAGFIGRFGFFPLAGQARGLRQPIHADDLAAACTFVLERPATFDRIYTLTGAEIFTYREMVGMVFDALGKRRRCIVIPPDLFRALVWIVRLFPAFRYLNSEMVVRMNKDLCFDPGAGMAAEVSVDSAGEGRDGADSELGFIPRRRFADELRAMLAAGESSESTGRSR